MAPDPVVGRRTLAHVPGTPSLNRDIQRLAASVDAFEASESVANTGTGARREGEDFERLIARLWLAFRRLAESGGASVSVVVGVGTRRYARLTVGQRSLFAPAAASENVTEPNAEPLRWLEVVFGVSDLVAAFPTEGRGRSAVRSGDGPVRRAGLPDDLQRADDEV